MPDISKLIWFAALSLLSPADGFAGQIYEWTSDKANNNRYIVKGGSWDDRGCGVCRSAARHSRPANLKQVLIGFRLVTN